MKAFYLIPLLFFFVLEAQEVFLDEEWTLPIHLEHAVTGEQIAWGLMQRKQLPENSGMTFTYRFPSRVHFWMFNCYMDLSVAFLDERKVIREIFPLKAYPEKMDKKRPVRKIEDLGKCSQSDPIIQFFLKEGVSSSFPTRYALEMNKNWFQEHGVEPGDVVWWESGLPKGWLIRTLDLAPYLPLKESLTLHFSKESFRSLRLPKDSRFYKIEFLNNNGEVVDRQIVAYPMPVITYQMVSTVIIKSI